MAIVAHVLFVLQLVAVLFLQEVDRAVRRRDIPADLRLLFHVVTQEFPQGFAEDHVLKNNNNNNHHHRHWARLTDRATPGTFFSTPDVFYVLCFAFPSQNSSMKQMFMKSTAFSGVNICDHRRAAILSEVRSST